MLKATSLKYSVLNGKGNQKEAKIYHLQIKQQIERLPVDGEVKTLEKELNTYIFRGITNMSSISFENFFLNYEKFLEFGVRTDAPPRSLPMNKIITRLRELKFQ